MPGMSGLELAERLRAAARAVHLRLLGRGRPGGLPPGSAFLEKPFDHGALLAEVRALLDQPAHRITPMIDESTDLGALVARHLREDRMAWLTTVTPGGAPLPSPVWFWWDGDDTVLVFSLPDTARTRNIEANPKVSLNFAGDGSGGDIVILSGLAPGSRPAPSAAQGRPVREEVRTGASSACAITPEQFAQRYSMPIRISLTKVRGHK